MVSTKTTHVKVKNKCISIWSYNKNITAESSFYFIFVIVVFVLK